MNAGQKATKRAAGVGFIASERSTAVLALLQNTLVSGRIRLEKLLAKVGGGIAFNEHLAGDGAMIFKHACRLGFEGIVSKHREWPYRSGRSKSWIKVKNLESPAMLRLEDWRSR
jgi:ATP-dependent DNA ligase